jgi:hypothetical protein
VEVGAARFFVGALASLKKYSRPDLDIYQTNYILEGRCFKE